MNRDTEDPNGTKPQKKPGGGRRRRSPILRVGFILLVCLLLVPLLLLTIPPLREGTASAGLRILSKRLPGEMSVSGIDWDALNRLRVHGYLWTAAGDTLACADELDLRVKLGGLIRREISVKHLRIRGLEADLPNIRRHRPPAAEPASDEKQEEPAPSVFPPDLNAMTPPIELEHLSIRGGNIRFDERNRTGPFVIDGSLNLSTASPSKLTLDTLTVSDAAGRWELESLTLKGDLDSLSVAGTLAARVNYLQMDWFFEVRAAETILVTCSPIILETITDEESPPATAPVLDCRVAFNPADSTLDARNLRLTGELGEYRLDATLDRSRNLTASLDCEWAGSPLPGLMALLPELGTRGLPDSLLAASWPVHESVRLELETDLQPSMGFDAVRGRIRLDFRLPGPEHLSRLLPQGHDLKIDDLGMIRGRLEAGADLNLAALREGLASRSKGGLPDLSDQVIDLNLDLGPTEWIEKCRACLRGRKSQIYIDSLGLSLPGLRFDLTGRLGVETADLRGELEVPDRQLLGRLGAATRDLDVTVDAAFGVSGPLSNPVVSLECDGRALLPDLLVPRYEISLDHDPAERRFLLRASDLTIAGDTSLELVELTAILPADTLAAFPMQTELRADGETLGCRLIADVASIASADRSPAFGTTVQHLGLRFEEHTLQTGRPFNLLIDPNTRETRLQDFVLAGELGSVRAEGSVRADTVSGLLQVDLSLPPEVLASLPVEPFRTKGLGLDLQADARVGGRLQDPFGSVVFSVKASPRSAGEDLLLEGDARIIPPGDSRVSGVHAGFELSGGDSLLLSGDLSLPGRWSSEPAGWAPDPASAVHCGIKASGFELKALNAVMPPGLELEGRCRLNMDARGVLEQVIPFAASDPASPMPGSAPVPDFDLSGELRLDRIKATIDSRSWLAAHCSATVSGTARSPEVRGRFETISGVIELPPPPPELHPVEGIALLWEPPAGESDPYRGNGADSTGEADKTKTAAGDRLQALDLDFQVLVPGEVWLRGPGLEVEVGADLEVVSSPGPAAAVPVVASGTVEARRGSYRFMGRQFNLEKGLVTLYGQTEPDPDLDIALRTEVEDAVVRILVTGTAREPHVSLISDPEMSEGEILTLLVTAGGGSGDADAGALLVGLGLASLQQKAAEHLGVDTIEYFQPNEEGEAGSLAVGKYLSPKLMIRYEQSLDESSAFLVKLNYLLNRRIKLETSYEAGGNSGIEVFWTKEH